ncbi:MAG: TolC family protein [Myxococcales bacterium]|nr:TolC family protein [Myxococcales bacterium]
MARVGAAAVVGLLALQVGCAGTHEAHVRQRLASARERQVPVRPAVDAGGPPAPGTGAAVQAEGPRAPPGDLTGYCAWALARSPRVRAAFFRFEAAVHRIAGARRLPEPTVGFGLFLRSVETRVGPQRARISLQQAFPWPTRLLAGADAASAEARAAEQRFEAESLAVVRRVSEAYWQLWQLRRVRVLQREHLIVLRALSEAARARLITGAASLADQQQIDLSVVRFEDALQGLEERERVAQARLRAAAGLSAGTRLATPDAPPGLSLPSDDLATLAAQMRAHPGIVARSLSAEARESSARAAEAQRFPSFMLGADWIVTGSGGLPGDPDRGKDAVMVGAGLSVPLWQGSYADAASAARAEAQAVRADWRAALDNARAELERAASDVRDSARRAHLYQHALLPQAEAAYASVLGGYSSGRSTVAQTLLAQRDLAELRVGLARARAAHARAWSRLEQVSGRGLSRVSYAPPSQTEDASSGNRE